jgi:threonine/homoserine/homoserine lactone efflux protein
MAVSYFFLLLAIFSQFLHADAKAKAFFGIFFTSVVFIGLAMEALILMVATRTRFNK